MQNMTEEPIKIKADTYAIVAKREKKEEIKGLIQKYREKEFSFGELVKRIREAGGDITFGELQVETDKEKMETINDLQKQFNSGELTIEDFQRKVAEEGGKAEFWNYETDRNPEYKGDESRLGFPFSPYFHPKGKYFQGVLKKAVLRAIGFAHSALLKHYDKNIFIYDDERLKKIEEFAKWYIGIKFMDSPGYKDKFMHEITDISLGFSKEDVYYRARLLDGANQFYVWMKENYPEGFPLTEEEEQNLIPVV